MCPVNDTVEAVVILGQNLAGCHRKVRPKIAHPAMSPPNYCTAVNSKWGPARARSAARQAGHGHVAPPSPPHAGHFRRRGGGGLPTTTFPSGHSDGGTTMVLPLRGGGRRRPRGCLAPSLGASRTASGRPCTTIDSVESRRLAGARGPRRAQWASPSLHASLLIHRRHGSFLLQHKRLLVYVPLRQCSAHIWLVVG